MKIIITILHLFALLQLAQANTIIVDINGGGNYTSIKTALQNAAINDTIKVWPGIYVEQLTINKNIVLIGSGCENTVIRGSFNPTITMSSGKIQWFTVSSTGGRGIDLSGGTVQNTLIIGSSSHGVFASSDTSQLINCIFYQNGGSGVFVDGGYGSSVVLNVTNCISLLNGSSGFWCVAYHGTINLSYCIGTRGNTTGNQGCLDCNPSFTDSPNDFHVAEGGCAWNAGNPSLLDPDGSRSDIGYFGGPDCPIYPVVTQIILTPSGNTINIQAKARANY